MYRQLPEAIIAAREDEVLTHGQVLYGLVKPTKDMDQVESTAAMVNVIPKKRIYRMENSEDIDLFMAELMKRPLVLQPSVYVGSGIAAINCAFCTREERWVVVVNQAHPKIHGRIQMGIDMARTKMVKGEPFVLQFSLNAYLKGIYLNFLTNVALNPMFMFIDVEDAEIVIRYPGDRFHRAGVLGGKVEELTFTFDDLLPSEIVRRTVTKATSEWQNPALRVIPPNELNQMLPGWEFEQIDPMEGVEIPEEETPEEAASAMGVTPEEVPLKTTGGRIMGRAQRKANAAAAAGAMAPVPSARGQTHHVPVELHVPAQGGPQVLHHGEMSPPHTPGQDRVGYPDQGRSPYENLNRRAYAEEHMYAKGHYGSGGQRSPNRLDSPYEEMNVTRQPQQLSPRTPASPRGHKAPQMPTSPRTPQTPRTPSSHSPYTPTNPPYNPGGRGYNMENLPSPGSRKTYLTDNDDDDGGFSQRSPRSPQQGTVGNKYDTNFNQNGEIDCYGNPVNQRKQYNNSDRYTDSYSQNMDAPSNDRYNADRPVASPRSQPVPSERPVPARRGFHHHQGSGRSDTSAPDSGFGENDIVVETSHHGDKYSGYDSGGPVPQKTPYYNHAFEQESPERDRSVVDDIMAKHKAMAAKMMQLKDQSVQNRGQGLRSPQGHQEFYSDSNYGRELQKWRKNINDLEGACDEPDVNFSRSRLEVTTPGGQERMEESFI